MPDKGFRRQLEIEGEVTRGFERMEEKLMKAEAREKEAKERERQLIVTLSESLSVQEVSQMMTRP